MHHNGRRFSIRFAIRLIALTCVPLLGVAACASTTSQNSGSKKASQKPSPTKSSLKAQATAAFPNGIKVVIRSKTGSIPEAERMVVPYLKRTLGVPVVLHVVASTTQGFQYQIAHPGKSGIIVFAFASEMPLTQYFGPNGNIKVSDFTPVARLFGHDPAVMLARKGSSYRSLASLRASHKAITIGVAAPGQTGTWLAAAYLQVYNHVHVQIVPFSSGGQATSAALGGSINLAANLLTDSIPQIKSGLGQAVVQFAPGPVSSLPGVKNVSSSGNPSEVVEEDLGVFGPKGMPANQKQVLAKALNKIDQNSSFEATAKKAHFSPDPGGTSLWSSEVNQYVKSIKAHFGALKALK